MKNIRVKKRNGKLEDFDVEKIHRVIKWAIDGYEGVSVSDVAMHAELNLFDKITTKEIHDVLVQSASDLISEDEPNYQWVASRLLSYKLRKDVWGGKEPPRLLDHLKTFTKQEVYDSEILEAYTEDEINKVGNYIKHDRDYNFTYAGLQQLIDKYLLKHRITGELYETPQLAYMLISLCLFQNYPKEIRLDYVKKAYDYFSTFKINLPTPIMAGVRTKLRQFASCILVDVDDSLDSIFSSVHAIGKYTSQRAGIGMNVGRIRPVNSPIRDGEVVHTGVVPFLKVFEATVKSTSQNALRGGGATCNVPWWHFEIEDIVILKNNAGTDDNRVRKLDYCIQLEKVFYERVVANENITLLSPHECKGLYDVFGHAEFKELYEKYELDDSIKIKKVIPARKLIDMIAKERLETGRIYIMNVDNCNQNGSWNVDCKMTNLCVAPDTLLLTKNGYFPIKDLENKEVEVWNGKKWSTTTVRKTSEQETLIEVTLSDGRSLKCTPYHKWYIAENYNSIRRNKILEKRTIDLKIGDKLDKFDFPICESNNYFKYPYTHGFFCADGTYESNTSNSKRISLYGEKRKLIDYFDILKNRGKDSSGRLNIVLPTDIEEKFVVPINYNLSTKLRWLEGYLDGDGTVAKNGTNESIQAQCIHKDFLSNIQLLLDTIGIKSKLKKSTEAKKTLLPDGNGGLKEYDCKTVYRLLIPSYEVIKLLELGFNPKRLKFSNKTPQRSAYQYIKISNISILTEKSPVYCVSESEEHKATFNGILTGNCVEIIQHTKPIRSLEDKDGEIGVCILSSINILEMKNEEDIKSTCDIIVRLLDELIDYQQYPVKAAENFCKKRRSLGIGVTNFAAWLAKQKLFYDNEQALLVVDELFEKIQYYLLLTSNELAKEKGACERFADTKYSQGLLPFDWANKNALELVDRPLTMDWEDLRKRIKKWGLRHSTVSTQMPVESSSVITSSTNGIEPIRKIISFKKAKNGTLKQLAPMYPRYKNYYTLAFDIKSNDCINKIAAIMQKWIDMSISLNHYYNYAHYPDGQIPRSVIVRDLITAYKYGIKTLYYANSPDGDNDIAGACASGSCSI